MEGRKTQKDIWKREGTNRAGEGKSRGEGKKSNRVCTPQSSFPNYGSHTTPIRGNGVGEEMEGKGRKQQVSRDVDQRLVFITYHNSVNSGKKSFIAIWSFNHTDNGI